MHATTMITTPLTRAQSDAIRSPPRTCSPAFSGRCPGESPPEAERNRSESGGAVRCGWMPGVSFVVLPWIQTCALKHTHSRCNNHPRVGVRTKSCLSSGSDRTSNRHGLAEHGLWACPNTLIVPASIERGQRHWDGDPKSTQQALLPPQL